MKLRSRTVPGILVVAACGAAIVLLCSAGSGELQNTDSVSTAKPALSGAVQVNAAMDTHLDKAPPRRSAGLTLVRNGWTYNCMECHKLLTAKWHYEGPVKEHKDIHLDHGNNRFCINCHHPTHRNAFVDYDGSEIAEAEVVQLCAKCHGTIYRDWKAGVHGRQNGFWKASLGEKANLRCTECHDPHSPKFKAMPPLAALRYPPRGAHVPTKGSETLIPSASHLSTAADQRHP